MPRTDTVPPPGCPAVRVICFDNLGLTKVLESPADKGDLQVVARWGEPDLERGILSASISSEEFPVLAVARRNHVVELLDPCSGATLTEINVSIAPDNEADANCSSTRAIYRAAVAGIHLFRGDSSGMRSFLTCSEEGNAVLQRIYLKEPETGCSGSVAHDGFTDMQERWSVRGTGSILCLRVDASERYVAFGGNGVDVNLWNLDGHSKIWEAKAPPRDSTGLMSPPYVTASTFLGQDHSKLVVGTGHHQIRLYDVRAQRRPMLAFDFLESPIKAVEADLDGYTVFVGNGSGDLATFDMRTGMTIGAFKGRCSGSIRSIARHPNKPIIAACGLDRYLRVFHVKTRQLLSRVFLKQQLVAAVFDTNNPKLMPSERDSSMAGETNCISGELNGQEVHIMMAHNSRNKKSKRALHSRDTSKENFDSIDQGLHPAAMEQTTHMKKLKRVEPEKETLKKRKKRNHIGAKSPSKYRTDNCALE